MKLDDLRYEDRFYLDGIKYKQFIRIKNPVGEHKVLCLSGHQGGDISEISSEQEVKLIIKS